MFECQRQWPNQGCYKILLLICPQSYWSKISLGIFFSLSLWTNKWFLVGILSILKGVSDFCAQFESHLSVWFRLDLSAENSPKASRGANTPHLRFGFTVISLVSIQILLFSLLAPCVLPTHAQAYPSACLQSLCLFLLHMLSFRPVKCVVWD